MALPAQVSDLLTQTSLGLRALRDLARRLGPGTRHSLSARFLLNLCNEALSGLFQRLQTEPGDDPGDVQRNIKVVKQCGDLIHLLLAFATEPAAGRVPQAMAAPLAFLAAPLVQRTRVLIYYDWRPSNYSFRREFPKRLREVLLQALCEDAALLEAIPEGQWPEAVRAVPPVFAVLSLPAAEERHVLLHSALAHEVGHALSEKIPFDAPPLPPDLQPYQARRIVANWLEELLADAWSIFLVGPAPLLSLIELSAQQHAASDDHPCNLLRFTLMRDCLLATGFLDANNAPVDLGWLREHVYRALAEAEPFQPPANAPPHFQPVHAYLQGQLTTIVAFVFDREGSYSRTTWDAGVPQGGGQHALVSRILHCAPPDTLDPTNAEPHLGSILNAGWAVRTDLATWQEFSSQFQLDEPEYESLKRLNQLLLKAIENTSVRREWRQVAP